MLSHRAASFTFLSVTAILVGIAACGDDDGGSSGGTPTGDGGTEGGPVITGPRPVVCDPATVLPTDLRCAGLYSNFDALEISKDAREFSPGIPLWSDGAAKRRFLYLPPNTQIDTSDMDEWVFPVGTKVWKEFQLAGQPVETRMFVKTGPSAWSFTTYVWDAEHKNAYRLDTGKPNAVGDYEVPSRVHCSQCHNGHADRLLGVEAVSLGLPTASGLTLATLKAENRLSAPPANTTITLPGDEKAQRALGWLNANCGIACHSPAAASTSGFTGLILRLNAKALLAGPVAVTDTDTYKTAVNKPFVSSMYLDDPRYASGYMRITPKNPDASLLVAAISQRGQGQMPPIVSHKVDDDGVRYVREWIQSLP